MTNRSASPEEERSLGEILDSLKRAEHGETVSVNDVLAAFDDRSSGVLITMLGLLAALPVIGAIPGMSISTGLLLLAVLAHSMFGGGGLRMPGRLGRLSIKRERFERGLERGRKLTDPVDRLVDQRLTVLTGTKAARAALKAAVAVLAVTMFPLAFVPWGVTAPAVGIVAFGIALIARDGLFALIGYAMIGATVLTFLLIL